MEDPAVPHHRAIRRTMTCSVRIRFRARHFSYRRVLNAFFRVDSRIDGDSVRLEAATGDKYSDARLRSTLPNQRSATLMAPSGLFEKALPHPAMFCSSPVDNRLLHERLSSRMHPGGVSNGLN